MKEYGTNIQKLADVIMSVADREQRTKQAHVLIELMRQIHPQMREGQDYSKKLWDDLYIITDFELDVDSPYPPPPKEILGRKPLKVPYTQIEVKYRFYGKNIELLVQKAIATENPDDRLAFVSYLFKQMRTFYLAWNKETVANDDIFDHILRISGGKLKPEVEYLVFNGLIDSAPKDGNSRGPRQSINDREVRHTSHRNNNGGGHRNNNNTNGGGNNRSYRNNNNGGNNNSGNNNSGSNSNNGGGYGSGGNNNNNRRRRY